MKFFILKVIVEFCFRLNSSNFIKWLHCNNKMLENNKTIITGL